MDHIPDLPAFQGVLRAADNQYPFAELKFRKGNEEKIKHIVEKMFVFLTENNYITEDGVVLEKREEYKKLALYLVLNAEMSGLPALPGPLLAESFERLHMRPFLYEMVAYCRPALALQLADACIADMQPDDPACDPQHPARLAEALYRLMCHLLFLRAPPADAPAAALAGLRACLVHLDRLYRNHHVHLARILRCTFDLKQTCYSHFTSVKHDNYDCADIYRDTHGPDGPSSKPLDFKICDGPDRAISESLRASNALLLNYCAALVINFTVELCVNDELKQTVSEICYKTNAEVLQYIPDTDHRILERISIQPDEFLAVVDIINPDVIVAKTRAGNANRAWLDELLQRPALCHRPAMLRLLRFEAASLDNHQSARLFEAMVWLLKGDTEDACLRRTVAIEAFRRCNESTKYDILADQFREYFHDNLMTVDFETALSETFDRVLAGDAETGDVFAVFVQNPGRTLERLVRAVENGEAQCKLMIRITVHLGKCRERCYRGQVEPAFVRAVNSALDDTRVENDVRFERVVRFVAELVVRKLLHKNWLF